MIKTTYEIHDAAELLPRMSADEYRALREDIRKNGLQTPIKLWNGKVIDGRHRYRACLDEGVEPNFQTVEVENPYEFVLREHLLRRNLTQSQKAMAAARFMRVMRSNEPGKRREQAGDFFGVSGKYVGFARNVLESGDPSLVSACESGDIPVGHGDRIAKLEIEQQRDLVQQVVDGSMRPIEAGNALPQGAHAPSTAVTYESSAPPEQAPESEDASLALDQETPVLSSKIESLTSQAKLLLTRLYKLIDRIQSEKGDTSMRLHFQALKALDKELDSVGS